MGSLTVPLPASVQPESAAGFEAAVDAAVKLLRGPRSLWPVDTGRSKRAWRRTGSGWSSRVFNPLRYASFVEAKNGRPARRTLARHRGVLRRAAAGGGGGLRAAESTRGGILEAFAARERLETSVGLYGLYVAVRRARGRVPRIPSVLRALDRDIRRRATR